MEKRTAEPTIPAPEATIGEIVAADYRTARIFDEHGIDFCCGGKGTLADACREKGLDLAALQRELAAATAAPAEEGQDYEAWALPRLADHIVAAHHAYLDQATPQLLVYTRKIAEVHGARHPELKEIAGIFARIAADLSAHLREEEEVLFPAVRRIDAARRAGKPAPQADAAAIRTCLARLDREHQEIGDAVHAIRRLSGGYAIPADACSTYDVTYRKLAEFEEDLHKHVHLENNILFPKAARS